MSTAPVFVIAEEHLAPGLAAVGALVDAALLAVGTPYLPNAATNTMSGFVGWMRILEIASDVAEADVRPGLAGVGGFVDAVAGHDVAADARLTHADEDDVGIVSDTATAPTDALRDLAVGDRRPVSPPSVVFHSPPPTAPKYASFGRPFTPPTAIDRPPRSGPMLRHLKVRAAWIERRASALALCAA